MTPKEKAQQLFDNMYVYTPLATVMGVKPDENKENAKQCALIAADEIVSEIDQLRKPEYTTFVTSYENNESMDGYEKSDYWKEVKEEIEKL